MYSRVVINVLNRQVDSESARGDKLSKDKAYLEKRVAKLEKDKQRLARAVKAARGAATQSLQQSVKLVRHIAMSNVVSPSDEDSESSSMCSIHELDSPRYPKVHESLSEKSHTQKRQDLLCFNCMKQGHRLENAP